MSIRTSPIGMISRYLNRLRLNQRLSSIGNRYGRSYWRLPSIMRRRLYWESAVSRLRGAQTWRFGSGENVKRLDAIDSIENPSFGHQIAARPFRTGAASVSRLDEAWLVGEFASPVTLEGRLILSAFRDSPRILGLERRTELEAWLRQPSSRGSELPALENVWPMVNRLQTNYFHWLIEWCGRLELIEAYREETGCAPKLLIPEAAPNYIRESLTLLGFGPESWIPWAEGSPPRKVGGLLLPSFRGTAVAPSPAALQWLRRRLLKAAGADASAPHRIVYLSRPRGGWRSVLNDDEIADWFRSEGHEVLQPHRLPLAEQIRRFSEASLIVGLHGAGLTNILFAPHAALLELTGAYGNGTYFGMTGQFGQSYDELSCRSVGDDVVVDLEALKKRINMGGYSRPTNGEIAHA